MTDRRGHARRSCAANSYRYRSRQCASVVPTIMGLSADHLLLTMQASTRRYDLLHKRLDRFTQMLQALDEGNLHALHQTRVASRRLREILPVLQVNPDVARRLGRRLRKVTQRLGAV